MTGACLRSHVHHARIVHGIARGHMALLPSMHHLRLFRATAMRHCTSHLQQHRHSSGRGCLLETEPRVRTFASTTRCRKGHCIIHFRQRHQFELSSESMVDDWASSLNSESLHASEICHQDSSPPEASHVPYRDREPVWHANREARWVYIHRAAVGRARLLETARRALLESGAVLCD